MNPNPVGNHKIINTASAALNKVMDIVPSVSEIGERIFLSEQAHTMRARIDQADDLLTDELHNIIKELKRERDPFERLRLHDELDIVLEKKAQLEAIDDQLHAKSHSYTKAISKLYDKAYSLLKRACSTLDSLVSSITDFFSRKEAI